MFDEPRRHRWFMVLLFGAAAATAPIPFVGRETVWLGGLPLWLIWSLSFTVLMSSLTTWGLLRLWRDEETRDDEDAPDDGQHG